MADKYLNVVWQDSKITTDQRSIQKGHLGAVVWFTGLSGAGKSTLAFALESRLYDLGCHTYVLDGDNLRHGLCADLDFSDKDRAENIRRVGELSKLMLDAGLIVMSAFISPLANHRERVKASIGHLHFIEVYCNASLAICESRDVKGLYKRARAGEISDFTGISSPYEAPENPDLVLNTHEVDISDCVEAILMLLKDRNIINKSKNY